MSTPLRVTYIFSKDLLAECDKIQIIRNRNRMVHSLIKAYGLLEGVTIVTPREASDTDLNLFHSSDYISYLKSLSCMLPLSANNLNVISPIDAPKNAFEMSFNSCDDSDNTESLSSISDEDIEFGIGYDCPKIDNMFQFVKKIAGSTLSAAEIIIECKADIAINWFGGWHHAQRDYAAGFCYVNDVAIGIMKLSEKYKRILYIDLDVHHGDGVENAFNCTKRVLTVSFHIHEPGFFPPESGSFKEYGFGNGKGFAINAPYKFNIGEQFVEYFHSVFELANQYFDPEVFVIQCGGDILAGDPLGGANVIIEDMEKCISSILAKPGPKLFLGGGGYNLVNTSKYWTRLTALILGKQLDEDIPEHHYFLKYSPCFTNQVERKRLKNMNSKEELTEILNTIKANIEKHMKLPPVLT